MFEGNPQHIFAVAGADLGATAEGVVDNFAWGVLRLASGESLTLIDGNDVPGGALYVGELVLVDGLAQLAMIHSNGVNIYYDADSPGDSYLGALTYTLDGGGWLRPYSSGESAGAPTRSEAQVPEPGGTVLILLAAVMVTRRGGWSRSNRTTPSSGDTR